MGFWLTSVSVVAVILVASWIIDKITFDISGKYILITGCDRGFGNLLAKKLDRKECYVFAACLTEKGASDLKAESSDRLQTISMNVAKSDSIKAAFEMVKKAIPEDKGLWGLVNNAGVTGHVGQYDWWTRDEFRSIIEVNCLGVVEVTNVFLPLIKKAKGRIVNVSSAHGIFSMATGGYEISKYGVEAFSDGLRVLMKPFEVSVHIVEPGYFRTELTNSENTIFPAFDRAWNRLTQEQRDEYGEEYYRDAKRGFQRILDMASDKLYNVTDAMDHALTAWWPWRRYLPGLDAKLFYKPFSMLPAMFTDNVVPLLGVTPVPDVCKKK